MIVNGINYIPSYNSVSKAYSKPAYKSGIVPPVEKILDNLENSSKQIRNIDLIRYYAKEGIQNLYSKGQIFSITV